MELGFMGRLQVDAKELASDLLKWFPNCESVSDYDMLDLLTGLIHALDIGGMAVLAGSLLNASTCILDAGSWKRLDACSMVSLALLMLVGDNGSLLNGLKCTLDVGGMIEAAFLLNGLTCTLVLVTHDSCTLNVGDMTTTGSLLNAFTDTHDAGDMSVTECLLNCLTCTLDVCPMTAAGWLLNGLTCTVDFGGMTGSGWLLNGLTAFFMLVACQDVSDLMPSLVLDVGGMTGRSGCLLSAIPCTVHVDGMADLNLTKFDVNTAIQMPALPKDVTLLEKFLTLWSVAEHAIAWAPSLAGGFVIGSGGIQQLQYRDWHFKSYYQNHHSALDV
ncbi:hypothetical protein F5J12DRAFT_780426 [Pisolithus orientalis]|uniref:uncharacterized protein n=1 Tax=Pisolithus orientalis TaxID=936130 RepID=UPI0022248F39|nr:uncharacterized protein F5J12DRAFT_780426 [Pisolithus orientalis]KAI6028919.1 hypothetical protein F5J12DRAFT_780426 [Pisolithus orientalis]